jgi:hypothetical protein
MLNSVSEYRVGSPLKAQLPSFDLNVEVHALKQIPQEDLSQDLQSPCIFMQIQAVEESSTPRSVSKSTTTTIDEQASVYEQVDSA